MINGILSVFGQGYVLVFGAYYKLQSFIYLPVSGIIQGIRPLVGYNYGAGEHKRVTHIFYTALVMAVVHDSRNDSVLGGTRLADWPFHNKS